MALLDSMKNLLSKRKQKKTIRSPQGGKAVNKKVVILGVLIITSILIMVGLFSYEAIKSRQVKSYIGVAYEQQIESQKIAVNALAAASGDRFAFSRLSASKLLFSASMDQFSQGDSDNRIPPLSDEYSVEFADLKAAWSSYDKNITAILSARNSIEIVNRNVTSIDESIPNLKNISNLLIAELVKANAPRVNIKLAANQLMLVHSLEHRLHQILNDGEIVMLAAERFSSDSAEIDKQLQAMIYGNTALDIKQFVGAAVRNNLTKFLDLYDVVKINVREILDNSPQIFEMHESASKIQALSPSLLAASDELIAIISARELELQIFTLAGYGFGILALLLLIILAFLVVRESQQRLAESQDQNDRNQRAILRLLDEMTYLADGDLSTHTTVNEDITGAIADSVNYSIDALRDLVSTINNTAVQVRGAVRKTQNTAGELAEASDAQAREISSASAAITEISDSMSEVSERATDSAEVARKSVSIAHKGGETVRQTIQGMETIREQIQETSKRIKRLGESSQEIGDIVNLITEISDQTNILALNAAIQASMAGEAGRGFAVVADEVQRLAERTGDATKQIEALVKTIQADTNEAMVSMEHSTANVVKGAKLTENAGGALDRIEQVSMNLAQRILEISDATKSQAIESVKITQTMDVIQQITLKTSEGSSQASESIGELSSMVKAMQNSVAGFKLPGVHAAESTMVIEADELSGIVPEESVR